MRWLIRKFAALVAAYGIVLQAFLSGFAPITNVAFEPLAVICVGDGLGEHTPSTPQHGTNCDACLAACSGLPALTPASLEFAPIVFAHRSERLLATQDAPSLQRRHQPQASRAPPVSS
jgi:hypothetical protein